MKAWRAGRVLFGLVLLLPALALGQTVASDPIPGDETTVVEALLARMTLEEKLGQLTQYRGRGSDTGPRVPEGGEAQIREGQVGSFLGVYGADYSRQMQQVAVEESRLGIPLLFAHDVIHGFRTTFPVPLAEAASFDLEAVENAARIAAVEATAHGLHWTFAPMVDIARDPRWGRIVEGAGEDPYLGSRMAEARVRGFQGADLTATDTLLATAKHFVAYGGAEGGRDYNTVDVSERTLHEIYLPPFKAAVDAGVQSIMPAFNEVAGVPMHAHRPLIETLLREQWGFDGVLVSDYNAIQELMPHGVAATRTDAGILGLEAGVDIDMVSGIYLEDVAEAVRDGRLDEALVDASVRRVLRAKYRLGLFDDPYRYSDAAREVAMTLTPAHREAARELARKSFVLLKNDGDTLPLSKQVRTVAVIGPLADDRRQMLGNWAAAGRPEDAVTPLDGIRAALEPGVRVLHAQGAEIDGDDASGIDAAVRVAREADAVILMLGEDQEMSAEANNRTTLDLPGVQQRLAQAVQATGKPVVAVLFSGRPLSVNWLHDNVPSILMAWYPGVEAGHALADVLFGDHAPSGKLPVTFPRNVGQVPIHYNHKNTGRPPDAEDKYTSKYLDVHWTPLYPFGHGLTYTRFRYDDLRVMTPRIGRGEAADVEVMVTNTGRRVGDEVVQLYLRDDVASFTRPVKELRGFQRVTLQPGESRTLRFRLEPKAMALLDADLRPVVEPGTFTVFAGGSSAETIETTFEVAGD
ncbi:glycoside hydrolase family 3 N-terminal domain-containing protein [Luteimonas suaedae]|uniref:glycoside hydrolase family 3 N-terminal domain-containing protein n=1 Tax=Luteimonas suaedae TaxID=2605430 RepID=UPI0011F06155|nr:glycoside hydrolase family 3 N-terminal domain-containing protein [Luteimonas suaedae]